MAIAETTDVMSFAATSKVTLRRKENHAAGESLTKAAINAWSCRDQSTKMLLDTKQLTAPQSCFAAVVKSILVIAEFL